jgi:DMSO reductase anchor subunit
MKPTGWRELFSTAVVVGVVVYLIVRASYGLMPALPLFAGVTLLVLAIVESVMGYSLKARIEGRHGQPVQPLVAARAVALAKASALAGAVMVGVWAGLLGYLLPRLHQFAAAAQDAPGAVLGLVCAVALVAAAMYLQYCCRTPSDSDTQDRQQRNR